MKRAQQLILALAIAAVPTSVLFASANDQKENQSFQKYMLSKAIPRGYTQNITHLSDIKSFVGNKRLENGKIQIGIFSPKIEATVVFPQEKRFWTALKVANKDTGKPQIVKAYVLSDNPVLVPAVYPALPTVHYELKYACCVVDTRTGTKEGQEKLLAKYKEKYPHRNVKICGPYSVITLANKEVSAEEFDTFSNSLQVKFEEK